MNRILSLIGVVLVVGCGPEPRDVDTLQQVGRDGVYMNPEDGQPYSGRIFGMENNGRRMTGSLKDGVGDGPYEIHNNNGQLQVKGTFKNGEQCGEWFIEGETFTHDPC